MIRMVNNGYNRSVIRVQQVSKHDVHRLKVEELKALLPCELTADGEIIGYIIPANDVHNVKGQSKAKQDVHKLTELPFSKSRQSKHTW